MSSWRQIISSFLEVWIAAMALLGVGERSIHVQFQGKGKEM
jgi:hypothetical protein